MKNPISIYIRIISNTHINKYFFYKFTYKHINKKKLNFKQFLQNLKSINHTDQLDLYSLYGST